MRRQRRIRLLLALLSAVFIPVAGGAQSGAECRKRILVFLDVSGSMLPTSTAPSSPFQQSVAALEGLLREPGFIEEGDVVEVVRFGAAVRAQNRAQGRDEIASLLRALRANQDKDNETDFRSFFSALTAALKRSDSFNAQVVLLGSDLVHEPKNRMPARAAIDDWGSAFGGAEAARDAITATSKKTAYVLFIPAAPSGYSSVQGQVLTDLRLTLPRMRPVQPGENVDGGLAGALLRGLLSPPELTIGRDGDDRNQLAWIVENPNCSPLHLSAITVQRVAVDGTPYEPANFEIGQEEAVIGGAGTPDGRRVIKRPIPPGPDWEKADKLRASVDTREGVTGTSDGTAGSWMKADVTLLVVERYLIGGPVLRVDLLAQGLTVEPKSHHLAVRQQESDDSQLYAEATFASPRDLDPQRAKTYRLVMRAESDLLRYLKGDKVEVWAKTENVSRLDGPDVPGRIGEDPVADRSNLFLLFAGFFALAAVGLALWLVRRVVGRLPVLAQERRYPIWWSGLAGLAVLPLTANIFHIRLLRIFSPAALDWIAVASAVVALFATIGFGWRFVQAARFAEQVLTAEKPLEAASYVRRSRIGGLLPWIAAGLLTGVFLASFFVWRKPVSESLARHENPTSLEVVADE